MQHWKVCAAFRRMSLVVQCSSGLEDTLHVISERNNKGQTAKSLIIAASEGPPCVSKRKTHDKVFRKPEWGDDCRIRNVLMCDKNLVKGSTEVERREYGLTIQVRGEVLHTRHGVPVRYGDHTQFAVIPYQALFTILLVDPVRRTGPGGSQTVGIHPHQRGVCIHPVPGVLRAGATGGPVSVIGLRD